MPKSHEPAANDRSVDELVAAEAVGQYQSRRLSEDQLWPTTRENLTTLAMHLGDVTAVKLQQPKSGNTNRIVGASLTISGEKAEGVFRLLQASDKQMQNRVLSQVAIHHVLRGHGIRVPKVLAFDSTYCNPVNWPYIFLTRAEGQTLAELYYEMSFKEKISVVNGVIDFLVGLENVTLREAGRVEANYTSVKKIENN